MDLFRSKFLARKLCRCAMLMLYRDAKCAAGAHWHAHKLAHSINILIMSMREMELELVICVCWGHFRSDSKLKQKGSLGWYLCKNFRLLSVICDLHLK